MAFRTIVRFRPIPSIAASLVIVLTAWGCAKVQSSSTNSTNPGPPSVTISVSPASASIPVSATQKFTAAVSNTSNTAVLWQVNSVTGGDTTHGTIDANGIYTAPSTVPSPATVTVAAVSQAPSMKLATAQVIITAAAPIAVAVTPTTASVQTGGTQSITATVQNDAQNKGVTWAIAGAGCTGIACGTLSSTTSTSGAAVTYTASATAPTPAVVTVTATSVADGTKTAAATITITSPPSGSVTVSISPKRAGLTTGQTQTFAATVSGSAIIAVTWEVDTILGGNASVGTISAAGVYTPPSVPGTHTVGVRSVADSTVSASANVAITDLTGVFTYHNNLSRDGANAKEYALNTSNVKNATFGKRFSCAIDAAAYAQPLWVANLAIGGGTHNVVIAATQHDTIYAFDADASPCQTYWTKSLLATGETWVTSGDVGSDDLVPDIGIVGTPVIDPATKTIYLVSKSKTTGSSAAFHQRLHALSLIDGSEKFAGPQEIAFTSGGITFSPLRQNQRAGLALVNGVVYVAYGSHGDNPTYYGWVVGYNASTLAQTSAFNDDPSSGFGGIWMSGGAPAADSSNNLYVITGNGDFNGTTQFGDSFLKLSTDSGIRVSSFFTPSNEGSLNSGDTDLGAGGAAILIDQPSSTVPHLIVGGGKEGRLYLLNRDNLGGNTSNDSGAVQITPPNNQIFSTPAFWQNTLYLGQLNDHLKAFAFNATSGTLTIVPSSISPEAFGVRGTTPSVSSQGASNGIVWAIEGAGSGAAVLHAYDATNLATELWNSGSSSGDQAGQFVKFTVPTTANGKVYVGTAGEISVYGLSPN